MIKLLKTLLLLAVLGLFFGCGAEEEEEIFPTIGRGMLKVKIDGVMWEVPARLTKVNYSSSIQDSYMLSIYATANEREYIAFNFIWFENNPKEVFELDFMQAINDRESGKVASAYIKKPNEEAYLAIKNPERADRMEFTRFDEQVLEGTFSFRAIDANGGSNTKEMTEGYFRIDLN